MYAMYILEMFTMSTYHHGDLRAALVQAGRDIVAAHGLAELTLRAVARRVGVSATAPYRHFASLEALLGAVAVQGFREFAQALRLADNFPDPSTALLGQGVAYVRFALEHPGLFRLIFGGTLPRGDAELEVAGAEAYAVLTARVATVWPPAIAADLALACWSMMHGLACLALDGRLPPEAGTPEVLAVRLGAMLRPVIPTSLVGE